jgi:hypothetical protein
VQVNHKLGGANVHVRGLADSVQAAPPIWSSKPTMLIGIDVSHPQSFDQSEPSIVGLVASMDKCAAFPLIHSYGVSDPHIFLFVFALKWLKPRGQGPCTLDVGSDIMAATHMLLQE